MRGSLSAEEEQRFFENRKDWFFRSIPRNVIPGFKEFSGGSRGANQAMPPPSKLAMEFGPRVRNSNDRIVNLCTFKDFAPAP